MELARRAARSNRESPRADALRRLAIELEEDRKALEDLMAQLGVRKDPAKLTLAWAAEKLGRLKLNGRLLSYSPLSHLEELELLLLGVEGKLLLWRTLIRADLGGADVRHLIERARSQRRRLQRYRTQAVDAAL